MKARLVAASLIGFLLALGLGLVIWRLAPVPSADARFVLAAVPLALWGIAVLLLSSRPPAMERETPRGAGVTRPAGWGGSAGLKAALQSRRLAGPHRRYRVPLFLVIGPTGMGKSSLIERSGLDLDAPFAEGDTNWWIGSDAIFVEATSGELDAEGLAARLESFRPARPVNGILIAVSPADLTLADAVERREIGESIALALRAVEARTRSRPPVYVVLTKIDLAPGFPELFETLEPGARQQPWGFTLPLAGSGTPTALETIQAFHAGIQSLVEATKSRLVDALSRLDDPLRGGRLVNFGTQVAALDPIVDSILKPILPNDVRKRRGAMLRGVFLTSARQDVFTIDALLPELAARYAMPRSGNLPPDLDLDDEENGFFIAGMFRRAILGEAGLAGRVRAPWYRRRRFGGAIALLALILAGLGAAGLRTGFAGAEGRIASVAEAANRYDPAVFAATSPDPASLAAIARATDQLQRMDVGAAEAGPWQVFVAGNRLPEAARASYERALRNSLLPHLVARLEADLVDLEADPQTLADLVAAASPGAPDHAGALQRWLEALASELSDTNSGNSLLIQAPRALQLAPSSLVEPVYIDTAKRIIAYKESQP